MKKFLEQRVDDLESEVKILRAKIKLNETNGTSKYINQYQKYDPSKIYNYDGSLNLMSEPDLETAFASPFDTSEFEKNPLNTITVNQPTHFDNDISPDQQDLSFMDYPIYPDILGSWDGKNPEDIISEDEQPLTPWGFESEFDKMDKDFLEWIKNDGKYIYENSLRKRTKNK